MASNTIHDNNEPVKIHPMRKLIRILGWIFTIYFLANIIFMVSWGLYAHFDSKKMCGEISKLTSLEQVINYAKNGNRLHFVHPETETATVLNHRAFMFRKACIIKFENGAIKSATLHGAD